jgi:hypothetical protein
VRTTTQCDSRPSPASANAQRRFRDRTAATVILDLISRPGAVLVSSAPPPRAVNASAWDTLCPRYQEAGDEPGTTLSLTYLDLVANDRNDGAQSVASFPISTAMFEPDAFSDLRAIDERGVLADALTLLGDRARHSGSPVMAAFHYADALALNYDLGSRLGMAQCLERVAHLASARGKPIHTAWFLGSAATIRRSIGTPRRPTEDRGLQTTVIAVRAHLDEDAFAAAWISGEALAQEEVIALALAFLLDPVDTVEDFPAQRRHVLDRAK